MKKIIFIILTISCIFKQYVYGQYRSIDSLNKIIKLEKNVIKKIDLYNCLVKEYINIGSYDTAHTYSIKEKQLSEKQGYKKGLANAYENIGSVFEYQSNYPEALKNQFASLQIRNEIFDKEGQANCYSNIGVIYDCQGNYPNALKHHFLSLKLFEKLNNKIGIANSYSNIGLIYDEQGNYDEALKNYIIALNLSKLAGEKQGIATSHNNIGSIYYAQGDYTKALNNHFASLKIKKELNDLQGVAYSYNNIGTAYNRLQDYKNSLHYQRLALNIFIEIGDKSGETISYLNIGGTELKKSNLIIAKRNIDSAFIIANDIDFMDYKKTCYQYFSRIDSAMGNFNDAYKNYKLFIQYRDSLNNKEIQKKTIEQSMTYEFEKKEIASKAEQDIKDKSAKEEKQKQQLIIFTVALILLIVLIFSGLLFKRFRLTNKQKGIIEQQKHLVEEKHKEITDSINYAERIQRTFLATDELLNKHLHNYFILFKPKDVVSGDFYWAETLTNGNFILATADSTGHGVPGAIMSLLNITSLEKAIEHLTNPAEILNHTRQTIIKRLKRDGSAEGGKDGMDCSLLVFDFKNRQLHVAAAHNPVWIVRENNLIEIKADKMPVGKHDRDQESFITHTIDLKDGDVIYTLTDGFPDQFGGEKGKKFMSKNLKELLVTNAHLPMQQQKELLDNTFNNWVGDLEQVDDVTLIGIKI